MSAGGRSRALPAVAVITLVLLALGAVPALAGGLADYTAADANYQRALEAANDRSGGDAALNRAVDDARRTRDEAYATLSPSERAQAIEALRDDGMISEVETTVRNTTNVLFGLGILLAVLNCVWQGFRLMGGSTEATERARRSILMSLLGLGTMFFAWAIVGIVVSMVSRL